MRFTASPTLPSLKRWPVRSLLIALALLLNAIGTRAQDDAIKENDNDLGRTTRTFAIRNAKIVQSPGHVIEHGTIVMRDGLIVAVGTDVQVPYDARVIEGDSLVVYAGFIDGLSHAGLVQPKPDANLPRVPKPGDPPNDRAGIQSDRDVRTMLQPGDASVDSLRMAGFTVAHVMPYGLMLPGSGALITLAGDKPGEMVLRGDASLGVRFAPADDIYPATSMAIMAKFRQMYREASRRKGLGDVYSENPGGMQRPLFDPTLAAFYPVIDGRKSVMFQVTSPLEVYRALALRKDLGGFPLMLGGLKEAYDIGPLLKENNLPLFLSLDLPKEKKTDAPAAADTSKKKADTGAKSADTSVSNFFAERRRADSWRDVPDEQNWLTRQQRGTRRIFYGTPATLHREGVHFGFSTADMKLGDIRENLRLMIANGLSEDDALAALTVDAARMLGMEKTIGTLERGKMANAVVTSGNYFNEKSQVRYVFADGRIYEYNRPQAPAPGAKPDSSSRSDSSKAAVAAKPLQQDSLVSNPALALRRDAAKRGSMLIRNATVLTVTNGTLENTDVLVRDGRIAAIGKGLSAPGGAETIDATGMFVMPGIIDAHSHIAISDVNEWTNPVTAEVWTGDVLDPYDLAIYRALAGGVTTSHVMHGSANVIGGQCETIKHRYGTTDPEGLVMEGAPRTIKFALGENPTRVHGRGFGVHPNTRMGVEDIFRRAFTEAKRYMEAKDRYEKEKKGNPRATGPEYNLRMETLAAILRGEIIIHCHSYRADEILMLMRVLHDFGIKRITFQHVNEGFKVAPELAKFGAMASVFSDWWAYKLEVYYSTAYNAAILTRNGVITSINSDSPELNRHLYHEAAKTMKYGGLTQEEALKLITINPAKQLGIDDRVGSLEVGKEADIAIFSAHPLSIYAICQKTIVDGVVRFDREKDPDDMRMNIDVKRPVDASTIWKGDMDECMKGTQAYHKLILGE